jgi:hypothetical protein
MPRKSEKHDATSFTVSTHISRKPTVPSPPPSTSDSETLVTNSTAVSLTQTEVTPLVDAPEVPPSAQTSTEPPRPELFSLQNLLDQLPEEPDWVVPGLLPTGVSLLAGPAQVDKALLANQLGLSVAMGLPFLERFRVRQGRVLYLALAEDFQQVRGRAVRLLQHGQGSLANFIVALKWSALRSHGLADLEDTIPQLDGLRLIIIDPLEFLLPTPQNTTYRTRQLVLPTREPSFFLPLRELAAHYRLAILLLHHLPEDWPANRSDPLAGPSPTGLTPASACNLLLTSTAGAGNSMLHIAGSQVQERRLLLAYDGARGQWRCAD